MDIRGTLVGAGATLVVLGGGLWAAIAANADDAVPEPTPTVVESVTPTPTPTVAPVVTPTPIETPEAPVVTEPVAPPVVEPAPPVVEEPAPEPEAPAEVPEIVPGMGYVEIPNGTEMPPAPPGTFYTQQD